MVELTEQRLQQIWNQTIEDYKLSNIIFQLQIGINLYIKMSKTISQRNYEFLWYIIYDDSIDAITCQRYT